MKHINIRLDDASDSLVVYFTERDVATNHILDDVVVSLNKDEAISLLQQLAQVFAPPVAEEDESV